MDQCDIYSNLDYFDELVRRLSKTKAGDRVRLATMSFIPEDDSVRAIMDELCAAANRGVNVCLMLDAHSFLIHEAKFFGPLFYSTSLNAPALGRFRLRLKTLRRLQRAGGRYMVTNKPKRLFTNPYKGRSHMKFALFNDYVMIGGCNLEIGSRIDFMVGWRDKRIADRLDELMTTISNANGSVVEALQGKDISVPIDHATELLLDAGKQNQSLILNEALRTIDAAKERILFTCQFFPNDVTIRHLAEAQARGVDVTIVYNHPAKHDFPLNLLHHLVLQREKKRRPQSFFAKQLPQTCEYIHAKLLVTEKDCIIGSHNLVYAGVAFGTAEIALKSTNRAFTEKLRTSLIKQLTAHNTSPVTLD